MNTDTQLSYDKHIQSDAWRLRKAEFFSTRNKECLACGSTEAVDLHHKTYARLGAEVDNDLVAMCETCHAQYHAIFRHASVTDSENFIAVKHASREGKALFQKHKHFIDELLLEPMKEYEARMAKLRVVVNSPAFELMSVKQKDETRTYAAKMGDLFNNFSSNCYMSILEMDNPHIGTRFQNHKHYAYGYLDSEGNPDPRGESNRRDLSLLLKYRWLQQEIASLIPHVGQHSELQKIKMILVADDINQSVVASGYRKKATGFWAWLMNP